MADLTVTLSESVTINGSVRGSTNNLTVTGNDWHWCKISLYMSKALYSQAGSIYLPCLPGLLSLIA